jgi:hypothetical protein
MWTSLERVDATRDGSSLARSTSGDGLIPWCCRQRHAASGSRAGSWLEARIGCRGRQERVTTKG